jgi:transcriptional regulator with XRE-family HTH domain
MGQQWYEAKMQRAKLDAEVIREALRGRSMPQSALAQRLGVSEATMSAIVHGKQLVNLKKLKQIAAELGLSLDPKVEQAPASANNLFHEIAALALKLGVESITIGADGNVSMKGKP